MNVANHSTLRRRLSVPSNLSNQPLRRIPPSNKRSRSSLDLTATASSTHQPQTTTTQPILTGVVACLSGLDTDLKDHIHNLITRLGGQYVRDFDPMYVTHLILDDVKGSSKYNYVQRNLEKDWVRDLRIVRSGWVNACEREGRRVGEERFRLVDVDEVGEVSPVDGGERGVLDTKESGNDTTNQDDNNHLALPKEIRHASLDESCNWMLQQSFLRLLSSQSVLLVGFEPANITAEQGEKEEITTSTFNVPAESIKNNNSKKNESMLIVQQKLSKLIRRAGGTIYWEPNDCISMVVVSDCCSEYQWEDVRSFCQNHPRGPMAVTAEWILSTLYHQTIKSPPFPSPPRRERAIPKAIANVSNPVKQQPVETVAIASNIAAKVVTNTKKAKTTNPATFRGDIFAIVQLKPPTGTVDLDKEEMELTITSHGGLMLTKRLFDAVRIDLRSAAKNRDATISNRKYYVVSTGGYSLDHTNFFPLLADLTKLGVKIVPVTPVWVTACVQDDNQYDAEEYPLLFQPQPWPIRLLNSPSAKVESRFLVSLTGFVDSSRYGIIWMLKAIGANYTDNLTKRNTHLICRDAEGAKYCKACEWGLNVVTVEWLYHVMRYGYEEGSEAGFAVSKDKLLEVKPLITKSVHEDLVDTLERKGKDNNRGYEVTHPKKLPGDTNSRAVQADSTASNFDVKVEYRCSGNTQKPHTMNCDTTPTKPDSIKSAYGSSDKPPQASLKDTTERNKRLHFALQSLETAGKNSNHGKSSAMPPRSQRRRTFSQHTTQSPSLLTQDQSPQSDGDNTQQETQFTFRVDADIGHFNNSKDDGEDSDVPLSQMNDAEDNGESQVVWFAGRRG
eukprot:g2828.t1 g2828   contig12:874681-877325(-)